jgi:hypothetical protein
MSLQTLPAFKRLPQGPLADFAVLVEIDRELAHKVCVTNVEC